MQHIVFRLADSLPAATLQKMELLDRIQRFALCDRHLDGGAGCAALRSPAAAQIVVDALLWFDGQRYALLAWCIMPNHVHTVIEPIGGSTLSRIIKSW